MVSPGKCSMCIWGKCVFSCCLVGCYICLLGPVALQCCSSSLFPYLSLSSFMHYWKWGIEISNCYCRIISFSLQLCHCVLHMSWVLWFWFCLQLLYVLLNWPFYQYIVSFVPCNNFWCICLILVMASYLSFGNHLHGISFSILLLFTFTSLDLKWISVSFLNWTIIDLQYCVSFRYTTQWLGVLQIIFHYRLLQDVGYNSQYSAGNSTTV